MQSARSTSSMAASKASHHQERADLTAAFRWAARLNFHEGVANHFSVAVNEDGTQFLMNPNQSHFSRIKASDLILVDANDPETMNRPDAPDPTAWGLHGALHRQCQHARVALHVHSIHATVLSTLQDPRLPPIDQNCAMFFNRYVIDTEYGGLAFEEEAERCCQQLSDPNKKVTYMSPRRHGHWRRRGRRLQSAASTASILFRARSRDLHLKVKVGQDRAAFKSAVGRGGRKNRKRLGRIFPAGEASLCRAQGNTRP